jgi:hypothetical protein
LKVIKAINYFAFVGVQGFRLEVGCAYDFELSKYPISEQGKKGTIRYLGSEISLSDSKKKIMNCLRRVYPFQYNKLPFLDAVDNP